MNVEEMYQQIILDHYKEKHHSGLRDGYAAEVSQVNPSCGDELKLRLHLDGDTITVPITELAVGDVVLVRAGARVPADGTILEGAAEFDEAMITGESKPVLRQAGDTVVAGTVATDNTVRVRIEAVGAGASPELVSVPPAEDDAVAVSAH